MVPIDYGEIKWKCEDERNESDANKPKCQFQIRLRWHHKCRKKRKKIHERYNSITYNFRMSRDIHTVFFYLCLQWHRIHWRPTTFSVIICCLLWENVCMLTFFMILRSLLYLHKYFSFFHSMQHYFFVRSRLNWIAKKFVVLMKRIRRANMQNARNSVS